MPRIPNRLPPPEPNPHGKGQSELSEEQIRELKEKHKIDEHLDAALSNLLEREPDILEAYREGKRKKP